MTVTSTPMLLKSPRNSSHFPPGELGKPEGAAILTGQGMETITSLKGQKHLPRWFSAAFSVLEGIQKGSLEIALPDGRVFRIEGDQPGPQARLDVRNDALFARVAREGELGFSEAYVEGWWDAPDLQAVFDVLLSSKQWVRRNHPAAILLRAWQWFGHWRNDNTRSQAKRNIASHYDLGNEFYGKWLDPTMTYSSAIFVEPEEDLAAAQIRKYASVCDRIGVTPDSAVLEIGCGWGGFAEYAAGTRGARITGLTISREQFDFAQRRMFEAGLADRVDIVMRDYREERGSYDGIASIEMIEAVGEKYWPTYFATVHDRLKPGAQATIQAITMPDELFQSYRNTTDFIQKYIFPGGMLLSPGVLNTQIAKAGLEEVGSVGFGESYSETLRRWHTAFNAAWDEIAPLGFDERFRRMWNFYLTSCAGAFHTGTTDVVQVSMRRPA